MYYGELSAVGFVNDVGERKGDNRLRALRPTRPHTEGAVVPRDCVATRPVEFNSAID